MQCPACRSMFRRPPQTKPLCERAFALEVSGTLLLSAHEGGYPHHQSPHSPTHRRDSHIITPFGVIMAPQVAAIYRVSLSPFSHT